MDLSFRPATLADVDRAAATAAAELGPSAPVELAEAVRRAPPLAAVADRDGRVIGIAYGEPRNDHPREVVLRGIAIESAVRRQRVGTRLLRRFEQLVADSGFGVVSLGSADGYVEHFYRANGYVPVELLVYLDADPTPESLAGLTVLRRRQSDGRVLLNVALDGQGIEAQRITLAERLGAAGSTLIVEKRISE